MKQSRKNPSKTTHMSLTTEKNPRQQQKTAKPLSLNKKAKS